MISLGLIFYKDAGPPGLNGNYHSGESKAPRGAAKMKRPEGGSGNRVARSATAQPSGSPNKPENYWAGELVDGAAGESKGFEAVELVDCCGRRPESP